MKTYNESSIFSLILRLFSDPSIVSFSFIAIPDDISPISNYFQVNGVLTSTSIILYPRRLIPSAPLNPPWDTENFVDIGAGRLVARTHAVLNCTTDNFYLLTNDARRTFESLSETEKLTYLEDPSTHSELIEFWATRKA